MEIQYFDVTVLCVLGLFALRGLLRGFVGEIAGLVGLLGGVWLAHRFYAPLATHLTIIKTPLWQNAVAYVAIFLGVIIAVGVIARLLRAILTFSFVAWADKSAGLLVGIAKGVLICAALLVLVQHFAGNPAFLRDSKVLPYLQSVIDQVRALMPPDMLKPFTPQ